MAALIAALLALGSLPADATESAPLNLAIEFIAIDNLGQKQIVRDLYDHIRVTSGDRIRVRLTYTNISLEPVNLMTCMFGWTQDEGGWGAVDSDRIIVVRSDGVPIRRIENHQSFDACNSGLSDLRPGESLYDTAELSEIYDMTAPGTYVVRARRILDTPKGDLWGTSIEEKLIIDASAHPTIESNAIAVDVSSSKTLFSKLQAIWRDAFH